MGRSSAHVPVAFPPPRHMPCPDCGESVATEAATHVCDDERRLTYRLFQLRDEIASSPDERSRPTSLAARPLRALGRRAGGPRSKPCEHDGGATPLIVNPTPARSPARAARARCVPLGRADVLLPSGRGMRLSFARGRGRRRGRRLLRRRRLQRGAQRRAAASSSASSPAAARACSPARSGCHATRSRPRGRLACGDTRDLARARQRSPLRLRRRRRAGRRADPANGRPAGAPTAKRPGDAVFAWTAVKTLAETRIRFDPALEIEGHGRAAFALVANADPYSYVGRLPLRLPRGRGSRVVSTCSGHVAPGCARFPARCATSSPAGRPRSRATRPDRIEIRCDALDAAPAGRRGSSGTSTTCLLEAERDRVSVLV